MKVVISLFHYCRLPKCKCIARCIFTSLLLPHKWKNDFWEKYLLSECVCIIYIFIYIYLGIRDVNQETSVLFLHLFTSNSLRNIHAVQYSVGIACCFYRLT